MMCAREKVNKQVRELNGSEARRHHLKSFGLNRGEEDGKGESGVDKSSAAVADKFGALAARE